MKPFCQDNLTYAVTNIGIKTIIGIEGRKLVGFGGRTIDNLLASEEKRTCTIIGESLLGNKLSNGSFTGNLGLLQRKEADVYLKLEAPIVGDENWLKLSNPIITANFLIIQEISNFKETEKLDLIENLNFGKSLLITFLTFTFLSIIIISFLVKIRYFNIFNNKFNYKNLFLISTNLKKSISYTVSALSIFLLFYHVYIWFSQIMIINSISTNQVIIDSSSIITDSDDCLTTKRTFCIIEGDTESRIISLSGKDNFLRKLFNLKGKLKHPIKGMENKINCIIEKSEKSIEIDMNEIFLVISEQVAYIAAFFISTIKSNLIGWLSKDPVFTMNLHVYHTYSEDFVKDS